MRFKANTPPVNGDTRTRFKFCWFPTKVVHEIVWLEFIHIEEIFHKDYVNHVKLNFQCWKVMGEL